MLLGLSLIATFLTSCHRIPHKVVRTGVGEETIKIHQPESHSFSNLLSISTCPKADRDQRYCQMCTKPGQDSEKFTDFNMPDP